MALRPHLSMGLPFSLSILFGFSSYSLIEMHIRSMVPRYYPTR